MSPDQTAAGTYCLQYRVHKDTSRLSSAQVHKQMREKTTLFVNGWKRVRL